MAVDEIRDGLSFRKAVKKYGIPKTTLVDYCKRGTSVLQKIGHTMYLTKEEEDFLVEWLRSCLDRGFPRQDENLLKEVQKILKADGRNNPFEDKKPGNIIVKLALISLWSNMLKLSGRTWLLVVGF